MSEIIFRLTGERTTQNLKNVRNSSLWTCSHIMGISMSQNKKDDFGLIVSLYYPLDNFLCSARKFIPYIYFTNSSDEFKNRYGSGKKLGRGGQNGRLSAIIIILICVISEIHEYFW